MASLDLLGSGEQRLSVISFVSKLTASTLEGMLILTAPVLNHSARIAKQHFNLAEVKVLLKS